MPASETAPPQIAQALAESEAAPLPIGQALAESEAVAQRIAHLLAERGETLAVAETAAGGLISATLLAVPGASAWFLGGVVAYSAPAKRAWLGLGADAFGAPGVVSQEGATLMAAAVRRQLGATWGLAEAGIAGPQTGRRSRKPAGLVYLAASGPIDLVEEVCTALDDRAANQAAFAAAALRLIERALHAPRSPAHGPRTVPRPSSSPSRR